MQRSSSTWIWVGVAAILLLLPGPAGRVLVDLLGGLTLLLLLLPLFGAVLGFLAWQLIRPRLQTCSACGSIRLGGEVCPACGWVSSSQTSVSAKATELDALDPANMTINVEAVDVEPSGDEQATR
ncbi:MAG: hypothetical protein VKO44_07570 [Cyanobacteriota bacterium]|jgi:hypothetical protein|nr:hypothetical protein [Cyanobacteriota bacterium]